MSLRAVPVVLVASALAALTVVAPSAVRAESSVPDAAELAKRKGRPTIVLDRLELPADAPGRVSLQKYVRRRLLREARRADWGAGRGSRIELRFEVTELKLVTTDDVLRVTCAAVGRLPKGKVAKSRLSFGGEPSKQRDVVRDVIEIVVRGVITRLAELERIRRGDLDPSRVRSPTS